MQQILRSYLKRLTNLSGNNRSLLLLKLSKEQDLDLHDVNFNNNAPSFEVIRQLVAGKKKVFMGEVLDSRDGSVNALSKHLKKLERREKFIFDERGAKDLYVGWPTVRGKLADGNFVRCPLLFFPVSLIQEGNKWFLVKRADDEVTFNKSFLLAYSYFNKIPLSDELFENTFSEFDPDVQVFKTNLYQLLKESPLEINFNQELFNNELKSFTNFLKDDFDKKFRDGELMLYPEAVLGIFPQAGSFLVPDYEVLLENQLVADLEDVFLGRTNSDDKADKNSFHYISNIKEEQTFTPYKLDAYQENALKAIKKGNSMVVQGPPGTGKSQLICNLIADYIARGKKVLLVCQKRAALDVVYQRLKEKELSDFVGLVHDFKNDRPLIYEQIASQIERLEEYKYRNSSLDALYLERTFLQASRQIDQIAEELEEFKSALFDEKECGYSIKELYLTSSPDKPSVNLQQEFRFFKASEIESFPLKVKTWATYANKFLRKNYLWEDRLSFAGLGVSDLKALNELLDEIPYYQAELSENLREIFDASLDLEDCEWIADREDKIDQIITLLENEEIYENFKFFLKKQTDEDELTVRESKLRGCFKGEGLEESLPADQLGVLQQSLQKASKARNHPVKWVLWKLFSKDKFSVQRVFVANKLEWTSEGFKKLIARVDNRMNYEHNITRLKEMGWLQNVPEKRDLKILENWFHNAHTALVAKSVIKELRSLKDYLEVDKVSLKDLKNQLKLILKTVKKVPADKRRWKKYLSTGQISKILVDYDYAIQLKEVLNRDFDQLVEFDQIDKNFLQHEKVVLKKLYEEDQEKSPKSLVSLFLNSIKLEWIDHIEAKYPVLRAVASLRMNQLEEELQHAVKEKLRVSKDIVLLRTRERTYKYVDYNRLNNMVTYRDLKHQVTKKRKIWPIRKVISNYHRELFELVPCWMASPESVSAVFPMETLFDLVIFDEASQCYAEKAVPGIYRGHQVVVTGDDKQLSPSDVYQARWEEEEDEAPELEVDSLLDLAKKYLMEVQLRGHYRSRSLELISFSNKHFYNNNLYLLPDYREVQKNEPSIRYIKTSGIWENQSNLVEAEAIADLVLRFSEESPEDSIGVVTFNFKQQQLIQEVLEEKFLNIGRDKPESLFVKNIENVQGDERDVIIFSIGYAPNPEGKFSMSFGTLNAPKGENRLNVAVTRARKSIYVISSILPNQLKVDNVKHEGPKLLKKYLEYAYSVSKGEFKPAPKTIEVVKADWLLKNKLKDLAFDKVSFELEEELPFADLTVKDNNEAKGLILTDDNLYMQSISVKDSHVYAPLSMESKNWKNTRFFSRQFWMNSDTIKEQIQKSFLNAKS